MKNNEFLVIILTYNSSSSILETLDGIYKQTYNNIKLIISDDASSDDTIIKCRKWLEIYNQRFICCDILESDKNKGTACNINRSLFYYKSDWIKLLAGDDILYPNYLEMMDVFIKKHPGVSVFYSDYHVFTDLYRYDKKSYIKNVYAHSALISAIEQNNLLRRMNIYPAFATIYKATLFEQFIFDERFPLCEDKFFFYKITKANIRICYANFVGVLYRKHSQSVQVKKKGELITRYERDLINGDNNIIMPDLPIILRCCMFWKNRVWLLISSIFNNRMNYFTITLINILNAIPNALLKIDRSIYYFKYMK